MIGWALLAIAAVCLGPWRLPGRVVVVLGVVVLALLGACEGNYLDWNGVPIRQTDNEQIEEIAHEESKANRCIDRVREVYERCTWDCPKHGMFDDGCEDRCSRVQTEAQRRCQRL